MSLSTAAERLGLTYKALDELLKGRVSPSIAQQLGSAHSTAALQSFIDGNASGGVATALDMPMQSIRTLRDKLGAEGAAGVIIGLLIAAQRDGIVSANIASAPTADTANPAEERPQTVAEGTAALREAIERLRTRAPFPMRQAGTATAGPTAAAATTSATEEESPGQDA